MGAGGSGDVVEADQGDVLRNAQALPEHLLLGLLREQDGVAAQVLLNLGLKLEEVREEVLNLLGAGGDSEQENPQAAAESAGPEASEPAPGAARRGQQT